MKTYYNSPAASSSACSSSYDPAYTYAASSSSSSSSSYATFTSSASSSSSAATSSESIATGSSYSDWFGCPDCIVTLTEVVQNCAGSVFSTITTFTDGYVFQGLYGALKENIAEYSGWYGVVALDVDTVQQVSGLALTQLGLITSGTALATTATSYLLANYTQDQTYKSCQKMLNVASTVSTAITVRFFAVEALANFGGTSKFIANQVGSMAGGILGGFAGIHLMGNEEPLFNPRSLMHCYTVKCIQCLIGGAVVDNIRPEMSPLTTFLTDQITGSLIYNAVDITNFVHDYTSGQAFNQALPAQLSPNAVRNLAVGSLATRATGAIAAEAVERIAINDILIRGGAQLPMNMIQREIFKLVASQIQEVLSDSNISPDDFFKAELERQFRPIAEELIHLQENHLQLVELGLSPAIRLLINAMNIHMNRIETNPRINEAYRELNRANSRYISTFSFAHAMVGGARDAEQSRAQLVVEINGLKQEMTALVIEDMQSSLCDKILYKLTNNELDARSPLWGALYAKIQGLPTDEIRVIIEKHVRGVFTRNFEGVLQPVRTRVKDTLRSLINPRQPMEATTRPNENISNLLIQNLRALETQILGFPASSEEQAFVLEQVLDVHNPLLVQQMMIQGLKLDLEIEEVDTRQFYTIINNLLFNHYSGVLGSTAAEALRARVEFQIMNSTLAR